MVLNLSKSLDFEHARTHGFQINAIALIKNGFKLVIYANQLLRAAYPAMQNTAKTILKNKRAFEADKKIIPIKEIINLIKND